MSKSEICPKCRTGRISPITTFDHRWRCELCGYQEYRGNSASSMVNQHIQENQRSIAEHRRKMNRAAAESRAASKDMKRAADAVVQARRASNQARKATKQAKKKEKQGPALGTIILIIIVLYILLKVL